MVKKKQSKKSKTIRNPYALPAKMKKAGPMKHKLQPKGGAKNKQSDILKDE